MQNTITLQRISAKVLVLMAVLVAIALVVGFVFGRAATQSAAQGTLPPAGSVQNDATNLPVESRLENYRGLKDAQIEKRDAEQLGANALAPLSTNSLWAYHHDPAQNKWYAYHATMTTVGPTIDEIYELSSAPGGSAPGCHLRDEPDC